MTVDNIFTIFDYDGSGQVAYRDLLIAFTLSMRGSVRDRLHWMFRFYDEEGGEEVYQKDMVKTLVRLCASTKSAENLGSHQGKAQQQQQTVRTASNNCVEEL
jgi:Ca2+-binding EF-hand superfamily protein